MGVKTPHRFEHHLVAFSKSTTFWLVCIDMIYPLLISTLNSVYRVPFINVKHQHLKNLLISVMRTSRLRLGAETTHNLKRVVLKCAAAASFLTQSSCALDSPPHHQDGGINKISCLELARSNASVSGLQVVKPINQEIHPTRNLPCATFYKAFSHTKTCVTIMISAA